MSSVPSFAVAVAVASRPGQTHRVEGLNRGVPNIVLEFQQTRKDVVQARRPPRLLFRGHCPVLWAGRSLGACSRAGCGGWAGSGFVLRSPRGGNTHGGRRAGGAQEKGGQQRPLDHVGRMYGTNAER